MCNFSCLRINFHWFAASDSCLKARASYYKTDKLVKYNTEQVVKEQWGIDVNKCLEEIDEKTDTRLLLSWICTN